MDIKMSYMQGLPKYFFYPRRYPFLSPPPHAGIDVCIPHEPEFSCYLVSFEMLFVGVIWTPGKACIQLNLQ